MKKKSTLKRLLVFLRPQLPFAAAALVLSGFIVALTLYVPILIGRAIDCIIDKGNVDFAAISPILAKTAAAIVATAVLQWIVSLVNNRITYKTVKDVREKAFYKLQRLPMSFFDTTPSGDTVSRIITDVDTFADGLLLGFTELFTGVLTIIGTLGFMFALNYKIALAVVVITPLSLFVARFISKRTYSMFRLQSETRGEQTSLIDEAISGGRVVKAFSHEKQMLEKYDEINGRLVKASVKATFFSSLVNPSTRFINGLVYAAVGALGAIAVIRQSGTASAMTVGMLSSFLSYANQYTKPFNEISGVMTELQNALACLSRIFELLDEKELSDDGVLPELENVNGDVSFNNISFSYTPDRPLIQNIDLDIKNGSLVAIVGPTGCGKTTLINLLMRFYDVTAGSITVDGMNIQSITRESLRRNFGMVLQETWLRSGTVKDNLRLGNPDADDMQIIAAAKTAHAHSFIMRLPQGYDTPLGDDGAGLSEGQRQLLCIARVILCLPPMLILDEATSSIDTRTEMQIQKAFRTMTAGRTSFVVAHRLSTIREADMILVMKDGDIIESGTHDELLKKGGFYANLYNSQFDI